MQRTKCFLLTAHGSLVWFDPSAGVLRHGSISDTHRNVLIEYDCTAGTLHCRSTCSALSGTAQDTRIGGPDEVLPLHFRRRPLAGGLFALEASGVFLCADAAGTVTLARHETGPWETFHALEPADLDWLIHVTARSWLSATQDAVVPRGAIRPVPNFHMQVGNFQVPMDEFLAANRTTNPADSFYIHYHDWKVEQLREYRPLIYLIAFGKDEIFASLGLTLRSLSEFGNYNGEVLLFTDRPADRLTGIIPPEMQQQVRLCAAPARDVLDYTALKYRICDTKDAESYQPILYLDVDVICNRPIGPVLRAVHAANRICAPLEFELLHPNNYYGDFLFAADPTALHRNARGFTSGLMGIPNITVARRCFPPVLTAMYGLARTWKTRRPSPWFDQPPANYVLHKIDGCDFSVLTPRVVTPVDMEQPLSRIPRLGFAHFCGGVGSTAAKLPAMQAYLDLLRQDG